MNLGFTKLECVIIGNYARIKFNLIFSLKGKFTNCIDSISKTEGSTF